MKRPVWGSVLQYSLSFITLCLLTVQLALDQDYKTQASNKPSALKQYRTRGNLLKTKNIALEKVTDNFTKIHIPENNEWQLILKTGNSTRRDGPFNNYDRNAWIYIASSPARPVLKLPDE